MTPLAQTAAQRAARTAGRPETQAKPDHAACVSGAPRSAAPGPSPAPTCARLSPRLRGSAV